MTVYPAPWEAELGDTIKLIQQRVDELKPTRLVSTACQKCACLAQDSLR